MAVSQNSKNGHRPFSLSALYKSWKNHQGMCQFSVFSFHQAFKCQPSSFKHHRVGILAGADGAGVYAISLPTKSAQQASAASAGIPSRTGQCISTQPSLHPWPKSAPGQSESSFKSIANGIVAFFNILSSQKRAVVCACVVFLRRNRRSRLSQSKQRKVISGEQCSEIWVNNNFSAFSLRTKRLKATVATIICEKQ